MQICILALITVLCNDPGITFFNFDPPDNFPAFHTENIIMQSNHRNPVVRDIEQRLGTKLRYKNIGTYAHEGTHELNAKYRNKYQRIYGECNAMYELNGRVVVLKNPHTTINKVAVFVPSVLKGKRYKLYLITQQKYWNNTPTYIFDEWTAYLNGLEACLNEKNISEIDIKSDCEASVEFFAYSCVMCMVSYDKYMNGREWRQTQNFMFWNTRRMLKLLHDAQNKNVDCNDAKKILNDIKTRFTTIQLRIFISSMLGKQWTKHNLGF